MSTVLEATANETVAEWESDGLELGERERSAKSLPWDIGDWWNRGQRYGERARIVGRAGWSGPTHGVCRETGRVAERWPPSKRFDTLEFWHHQIVAVLSDDVAIPLLQAAENQNLSANELRALVKQYRRATKEEQLGARQVSALPDGQRYGVIYADPPWRFEPWSRDSGMDRAADNHYPTLTLEAICALDVPAADDAVLFLGPRCRCCLRRFRSWRHGALPTRATASGPRITPGLATGSATPMSCCWSAHGAASQLLPRAASSSR